MSAKYAAVLDLTGRLCVVIGGGRVSERKIRSLLNAGALVRVVSPTVVDGIESLAQTGMVEWFKDRFRPEHLDGAWLAFAATNERNVNAAVTAAAAERLIFVNVADEFETGSLIAPATIVRGDLLISITTLGASPTFAMALAAQIGAQLGPEYAEYVALLRAYRERGDEDRVQIMRDLVDHEEAFVSLFRVGKADEAYRLAEALARQAPSPQSDRAS